MSVDDLAAAVLPLLGHAWRRGDEPITARDVRGELWRIGHQLEALDMVVDAGRLWQPGPSILSVCRASRCSPIWCDEPRSFLASQSLDWPAAAPHRPP